MKTDYKCLIAVTDNRQGILLLSQPSLFEHDTFDGCFLDDNIDNHKDIPREPGIYHCHIEVYTFQSNHPQDPEEWDSRITMSDIVENELVIGKFNI